jgi:methylmalonyl-CoA mutase N-terminal domain/subunit
MDEALALPSEKAARLAVRTQQVLMHESGVTNTVDPLAGSYFVESLTNAIERDAYDYFQKIEALGGVIPAIEAGFFHREIADASYRYNKEIDNGERIIVGVNDFRLEEPIDIPILRIDRDGAQRHHEDLKQLRSERDGSATQQALLRLANVCRDERENTMPYIIDAVNAHCTLGEIMDTMREVFGEYREVLVV